MSSNIGNCISRASRRGAVVMEVTMALLVCATVVIVIAQTVSMVARQRALAQRRHLASQEAANVMEKIAAIQWESLTQENVDSIQLSDRVEARVPDAKLTVRLSDDGSTEAIKIRVSIACVSPFGSAGPAAELVAWRYPESETQK